MTDSHDLECVSLTADIVSAYVGNNKLASRDVADLIVSIHDALHTASQPTAPEAIKLEPVVSIRASVKPDSITCLECGLKSKMLKRHLRAAHDLTPTQYRDKWGLPRDYPMVAAVYAEKRAALAKTIGLGRKPTELVGVTPVPVKKKTAGKLGIAAAKAAAVAHLGGGESAQDDGIRATETESSAPETVTSPEAAPLIEVANSSLTPDSSEAATPPAVIADKAS